jgi:nicotinamidase/pyrazinamidase
MTGPLEYLQAGDGLLLVDVQNDFCPGGALPIAEGDRVVPVLNRWLAAAQQKGLPVYASRDWHPPGHVSFQGCGGPWPPHCLEESEGARFRADLHLPEAVVKVTQGVRFDQDQNSAFDQTGFAVRLRADGVRRRWVGGLALDVCVLATVRDACREGFAVGLIRAGTRPVTPEGGTAAIEKMRAAGAVIVD